MKKFKLIYLITAIAAFYFTAISCEKDNSSANQPKLIKQFEIEPENLGTVINEISGDKYFTAQKVDNGKVLIKMYDGNSKK